MNNKILIAYASRTGSTVGVAEAIGKSLTENGVEVDVRPVDEITDLRPYSAVVVGSAIQGAQWLPEATRFVQTHREALTRKPFAAFLVCMTLAMKNENYHYIVKDFLKPIRALVKPVSEGYFAGRLDIRKIPSIADRIKFRISALMGVWAEGDHRDWNTIRTWAESLRPILLQ